MKNFEFWAIIFAIVAVLLSCSSAGSKQNCKIERYNICLVLDGTDRLSNQSVVPEVSSEEIVNFVRSLAKEGHGSFYVSYVDDNCDNNRVAIFEWNQDKPFELGKKPGYMKMSEYEEKKNENEKTLETYNESLANTIAKFDSDCSKINSLAYSDYVAKQKKGSDINGAINQAIHLLRTNEQQSDHSYIILISDGVDNVGKKLKDFPQSVELFIINSNVAKHQYEDIVSQEFVTLRQAIDYIFK